jgi:hypothetical protein
MSACPSNGLARPRPHAPKDSAPLAHRLTAHFDHAADVAAGFPQLFHDAFIREGHGVRASATVLVCIEVLSDVGQSNSHGCFCPPPAGCLRPRPSAQIRCHKLGHLVRGDKRHDRGRDVLKRGTMTRSVFAELDAMLATARLGRFRAAAVELGTSTTALNKAIAKLEQRLGNRLFNRTTRSVSMADAGRTVIEDVVGPVASRRTDRHATHTTHPPRRPARPWNLWSSCFSSALPRSTSTLSPRGGSSMALERR